jgi:Zn-dependent protease
VGGRADEILLWPLGGLASCSPPERPNAHLWTALGGPLVNVALIAVLTPLIGLCSGQWLGLAIPNPFDLGGMIQREDIGPGSVVGGAIWKTLTGNEGSDAAAWIDLSVILLNYISWTLLLVNLIPMVPLDGGRLVQALLWKRHGYARSMRVACRSGLVGAVLVGIFALASDSLLSQHLFALKDVLCHLLALLERRLGLLRRERKHLLHPRGVRDVAGGLLFLAAADFLLDLLPDRVEVQTHLLEHVHRDALTQLDQPQQQMLGADVVVVEAIRLLARQGQDLLRTGREVVHGFVAH